MGIALLFTLSLSTIYSYLFSKIYIYDIINIRNYTGKGLTKYNNII